jgi:hypothetical protein
MKPLALTRATPALALGLLAAAAPLAAQSVRIHSTTTMRYVQLRPILYNADSNLYDPQAVQAAAPVTQDFEVNAWGLGIDGLRAYGLFRFRGSLGSELVWPRYGDHFDALAAYLEYEHANYRLRLGRQQKASALGWYGFDGLDASWRPIARLRVEGYGGRGLARGYDEPFNSKALTALDPLRPETGTYLLGASVVATPSAGSTFSAIYQREILNNRSGVVSERVALDGSSVFERFVTLAGSADFDLATNEWGKARGSATFQFGRALMLRGEVFRYRPTLDLTTIWGVFGPQSHWGYTGTLQITPGRAFALWGSYTERHYQAVDSTTPLVSALPDREQEVAAGMRTRLGPVQLDGTYRLQLDYGGDQSGGDASLALAPSRAWRVGVHATAFQNDGGFRVANGTVYGAGFDAAVRVADRFEIRADAMRFMQRKQERLPASLTGLDWNQTRATVSLDWTFGTNPDRLGGSR